MRRALVAFLAVAVLSLGACTSTGSSSDGSSNGGSSNNGSSNNDGSSNNAGSSGGGGTPTTVPGSPGGTVPAQPPSGFTLPEPDGNGDVEVPENPPKELRGKSALERLAELPPVPRGCLDDDLTLLDVFVPAAAIPVRLLYCLVYIGTIARVPNQIDKRVSAPTADGQTVPVPLVAPDRSQRPLATLALLLLIVAVAVAVGYVVGRRRGEAARE